MTAIRHTTTVKPDGAIELRSPELRPGETVEVIVLLPHSADKNGGVSAFQVASELRLDGPPDWSEHFEDYLEGTRRHDAGA